MSGRTLSLDPLTTAAIIVQRRWRLILSAKPVDQVRTKLGASLSWVPANDKAPSGIVVLNLLTDIDPAKAASGINEAAQLESTVEEIKRKLNVPVFVQTFKRGPNLTPSSKLKAFIAGCNGPLHTVVTGHGGVSWAHYLGKRLVPFASFLAPNTSGVQKNAIGSLSRDKILDWVVQYLRAHHYTFPSRLCVSLDICQICADYDGAIGYVSDTATIKGQDVVFRGPVHAAFCDESRQSIPAFVLEMGPFDRLMNAIERADALEHELATLRAGMSKLLSGPSQHA